MRLGGRRAEAVVLKTNPHLLPRFVPGSLVLALALAAPGRGEHVVKPGVEFPNFRRVAVLDATVKGSFYKNIKSADEEGDKTRLLDVVTLAYMKRGYDVIERERMQQILGEQKLSLTGTLDAETTARLGKLLGVNALVFVTRVKNAKFTGRTDEDTDRKIFAYAVNMSVKMVAVETAETLYLGTANRKWADDNDRPRGGMVKESLEGLPSLVKEVGEDEKGE